MAPETSVEEAEDAGLGRVCQRFTIAILILAVAWRLVRYALHMPVWGDEAFLGLNLMDRTFTGMLEPLDYGQVAPPLFLLLEWLAQHFLGAGEYALRILPLLAGLGAVALFALWTRLFLKPLPAVIALSFYALGYYTVRYGIEIKPYGFDQLAAMALLYCATLWLKDRTRMGALWLLVVVTPLALAGSYPAVFVAGGIAIVMFAALLADKQRSIMAWVAYGCFVAVLVGIFLLVFHGVSAGQYEKTGVFMRVYWKDSFPPHQFFAALWWLVKVHAGNMLAYPAGGTNGGSTATLLLVIAGCVCFARGRPNPGAPGATAKQGDALRGWLLLALLLTPFALTLAAAAMQRYPYGGSARVAQHLAPAICVLAGEGLAWVVGWVRRRLAEKGSGVIGGPRCVAILLTVLLVVAFVGLVRDVLKPYKTLPDEQARAFILDALKDAGPNATVVVLQPARSVTANFQWYLRRDGQAVRWDGEQDAGWRSDGKRPLLVFNFEKAVDVSNFVKQGMPDESHLKQRWVHSASLQIGPVQDGPAYCQAAIWER